MLEKILKREKKDSELKDKVHSLDRGDIIEKDDIMYLRLGPIIEGRGIEIPLAVFKDMKRGSEFSYESGNFSSKVIASLTGTYKVKSSCSCCDNVEMRTHFDRIESDIIRRYANSLSNESYIHGFR